MASSASHAAESHSAVGIALSDQKPIYRQQHVAERYVYGGLACMIAATVTQPIDLIKVRLQLQKTSSGPPKYKGMFSGMVLVVKEEGIRGLFRGLPPSLLREATYSAIRLGLYDQLRSKYVLKTDENGVNHGQETLWKKIVAGMISGGLGCALCSPSDLIKVQMQALTPTGKPVHPSMAAAVRTIVARSGVPGLWAGVGPNSLRAMFLTASQLPSYDHTKHLLLQSGFSWAKEGLPLHAVCSMVAGFVSSVVTCPVDVVKSRVMNDTKGEYRNALDCVVKSVRNEGPLCLYKGLLANWLRLGPHSLVTFLALEQLRKLAGVSPV
ncbi:mitochondrial substrate carrier family protein [Hyaloraphidium curvatum]|nr:mitochondrial substrate carrier family protein [Hyaloraphidium curvatum]